MLAERPLLKMGARAILVGVGALISSLVTFAAADVAIGLNQLIIALGAGYGSGMTYVGFGAFTSVEPTVGAGPFEGEK